MADLAAEYREKLLDAVVETDEALMERYLDGQELDAHEVAAALKAAVTSGDVFPVACGVATKNLGTHALLDLLVEGVPSPGEEGLADRRRRRGRPRPSSSRPSPTRSPDASTSSACSKGTVTADTTLVNLRSKGKERMGTILDVQGKEHHAALDFGEGDLGAVAKLKDAQTGDLLADKEAAIESPDFGFPEPVMSFAITPKSKGDEEKVATAIRRLAEEDPTLRLRRDPQTGEEILSGMSQMHVEVALERAKRRFGVDIELHPPRVPYRETIRREARAHGRYKKQTGGRGQFGDCHIVIAPTSEVEYEFVDKIVGGVIPQGFRPAVNKGIQEAMHNGELAGAPVQGVRVELVDGSYHTVDSSEMAFKIAGSMAWKDAYMDARSRPSRADHGARGDACRTTPSAP